MEPGETQEKEKEQERQKAQGTSMEQGKQMEKPKQPRRFLLVTYPRSASNLLVRILALDKQMNVAPRRHGGYFFMPPFMLMYELKNGGKHVDAWTQAQRTQMMQAYQMCFDELEQYTQSAEAAGQIAFVKEHSTFLAEPTAQTRFLFPQNSVHEPPWTVQVPSAYSAEPTRSVQNETLLPDEFLRTWLPTFLIRHPALAFPSQYRALVESRGADATRADEVQNALCTTLHWSRTLYDWYARELRRPEGVSGDGDDVAWPLVLDADDVITKPEVIARFSEIVGMDSTKLQFTWAPASGEDLVGFPSWAQRWLSTLSASSGVVGGKTSTGLNIDTEARKWREEFGEHEGETMEQRVRAAMPDYEFLKARRLKL